MSPLDPTAVQPIIRTNFILLHPTQNKQCNTVRFALLPTTIRPSQFPTKTSMRIRKQRTAYAVTYERLDSLLSRAPSVSSMLTVIQ